MEKELNKYIAVAYKLYTTENDKEELVEEAPEDRPFAFITGFGITLEAFENGVEDYLRDAAFAAQLEPMLQELGRAIAEGEDYEDVENRLLAAYPTLDTRRMEAALTRVLFVADLWGRAQP